jgi:ABC-type Zn2+ transport system substrate-binding protein/surface adhesin
MSTVGKSQDTAWRDLLATKVLSGAAPILEEYGLSCENDMSLLDEDDLMVLCSKLKQFPSKLLRKWVQGLADEQRAAADMNDAPAAKKHSNSPPLEDEGEEDEDEDEEENGDEDEDTDEDEDSDEEDEEAHGGAGASKKVRGIGKVMKTCTSSARRARSITRRMKSEPRKASLGNLAWFPG